MTPKINLFIKKCDLHILLSKDGSETYIINLGSRSPQAQTIHENNNVTKQRQMLSNPEDTQLEDSVFRVYLSNNSSLNKS